MEIKFAENLSLLRKGKDLSQKQLAERVGVDQRTVSTWERGICEPNYETLSKLCEILNETFDGILT